MAWFGRAKRALGAVDPWIVCIQIPGKRDHRSQWPGQQTALILLGCNPTGVDRLRVKEKCKL